MLHPLAIKPNLLRLILQLVMCGGICITSRGRRKQQAVPRVYAPLSILQPQPLPSKPTALDRVGITMFYVGGAGFLLLLIWKGV